MLAFGIGWQTVPSSDIRMVPNVAKSEKRTDRFQEFHRVVRTTETRAQCGIYSDLGPFAGPQVSGR